MLWVTTTSGNHLHSSELKKKKNLDEITFKWEKTQKRQPVEYVEGRAIGTDWGAMVKRWDRGRAFEDLCLHGAQLGSGSQLSVSEINTVFCQLSPGNILEELIPFTKLTRDRSYRLYHYVIIRLTHSPQPWQRQTTQRCKAGCVSSNWGGGLWGGVIR